MPTLHVKAVWLLLLMQAAYNRAARGKKMLVQALGANKMEPLEKAPAAQVSRPEFN